MLEKFRRDESGVALPLAVIMIVLIGVMGAGLLVFVRNDLLAVVEVNQGQTAMDIADAGTQAAKAQLLADKIPAHYDVDDLLSQVFIDSLCNVDPSDVYPGVEENIARNPPTENWSPEAGGQTRSFAGGEFHVTIRWMTWNPLAPDECRAPVASLTDAVPGGTHYFKVISTGKYGNATRRIETIYSTYDLNVPRAYFTPGPITISGSACIDSVSLFSLSNVTFNNASGGCANGTAMQGKDLYYKAWAETADPLTSYPNRFNSTARGTADAGVGTTETINRKVSGRDYDSADGFGADSSDLITFPFDLGSQPDANQLCDEARAQGNYIVESGTGLQNLGTWPESSSSNTVVCYNFTNTANNNELRWAVGGSTDITSGAYSGCKEPRKRGILVVRGGGFSIKPKTALFEGIVVVRGPADQTSEVSNTDDTGLSGNTCLDGFINSTGAINISGTVRPSGSVEVNNTPGFYGVRTWGWRELYE